jgi:ligand-binding sensor domain-containing protein/signal transduction histidine kinase
MLARCDWGGRVLSGVRLSHKRMAILAVLILGWLSTAAWNVASMPPQPAGPGGALRAADALVPLAGGLSPAEFERISIEQGLSESSVWCIWQDRQGFMWFGTEDGLDKYDGRVFTVYKHAPEDRNSLSQNKIRAIYEDHLGVLWVGTASVGLNQFDSESGRFTRYQHEAANPASLSNDAVTAIFEDDQHVLWIGTAGGGLNQFDRATQQFTHFGGDPANSANLSGSIQVIYQDRAGELWIGTQTGLGRLDRVTQRIHFFRNDPRDPASLGNDRVWALAEDQAGGVWVGTDGGLDRLDRETGRFSHFTYNALEAETLSYDRVRAIYRDGSGALWIGTLGGGLDRLDPLTQRFTRYQTDLSDPASLSNNRVLSIYQDRGGLLWIGTYGGGLNKFNPAYQPFAHYKNLSSDSNSLSENLVLSVFADPAGTIWVGTDGGGLNQIDRSSGQITRYKSIPGNNRSLSHNTVRAILADRLGRVWVGTGAGLNRFEPASGLFTRFPNAPDDTGSLGDDSITALAEDGDDVLWIGVAGAGLSTFKRSTATFADYYFYDAANAGSLSSNNVLALIIDSRGTLWVGTDRGLNQFDRATRTFRHFRYSADDPHSLSDNYVMALHEDQTGTLWIGTTGGLNRFDPATQSFTAYGEKNGLPNDYIYGILDDAQGYLWLSSNKGLTRFDPRTQAVKTFDAKDGLQSDEFNPGAYAQSVAGELLFGGINGLTVFRAEQIKDNAYQAPIALIAFTRRGEAIPVAQTKDGLRAATLRWPDNFFEFELAALSYTRPEKNQYGYKLEGFDKEWNYIGTRRNGLYTNLPGGTYSLKLTASNNDGVWSETGAVMKVTVIPPVWEAGWFRGGLVVLVLGVAFGAYRWRVKRVEARSRELEHQVGERTREIQQRNQQMEALYRAGEKMYRSLTLDQVLQALADVAVDTLEVDKSVVFVWEAGCGRFRLRVARGITQRAMWRLSFAQGEGVVGQVAVVGQPQTVTEVADLPRGETTQLAQALLAEGIHAAMFLPICVGAEVYGIFGVCSTMPRDFGEDTRRLFLALVERAALSIENAQLFEQTKELAVMEERSRLARDLHDSAKQKAFAALAQLGAARGTLTHTPAAAQGHLGEAENLVYDVIQELTFLIQELYPRALKENGLAVVLREYVFEWETCSDLPVDMTIENARRLPLEIEQALYRICQEALANVARHSRASSVNVALAYHPDSVELAIADNGQGLDPTRKYAGLGLRSMRERAEMIGGELHIESAPGEGTHIAVRVRLSPAQSDAGSEALTGGESG